jgi:DNA helicase II / ATP-dependent DNA helicase PcrA
VSKILEDLNQEQRQSVEAISGPVMVIAGAGSGKTRVLTYRVARLLELGTDPFNILALTFTNKAAREMKERIMKLVGKEARNVWMGTFHSVFARILRMDGHLLGYPQNFTIYDTDDSKSLLRSILKEQDMDVKQYPVNMVLSRISSAKSNLISAEEYNADGEIQNQDKIAARPKIGLVYSIYASRCFKASAMDFDDLLFKTNILLRDFPEVLYKYQEKFRYILVDEYQDTNYAQYLIIKKLAARFENICVVGDDAQSIYAFRGANIQNILNFKNDYPDYKLFKLEQNYRSTQNIVNAANSVIKNNQDQIFKKVWTENESGERIRVLKAGSDNEEGMLVANRIFELKMNNQLQNDAFSILYRTNAQSRSLEEALRKLNIPYRIMGGLSFYSRKEIKDMLAYFRLSINHNDEESVNRVINLPARGIGDTTMQKIRVLADEKQTSIWQQLETVEAVDPAISPKTRTKISEFVTMIKSFTVQMHQLNAFDMAEHIAKTTGLLRELEADKTVEGISRIENIEELLNGIREFTLTEPEPELELEPESEPSGDAPLTRFLDDYMQDIALLTDADKGDDEDTNKVKLMTIHSAKGLEFPNVFITGMEENLFPSFMSLNSRADLEEERRLFYVALTRAMHRVTLTYAENRFRWGNLTSAEPSRFLEEIEASYLEMPPASKRQQVQTKSQYIPPKPKQPEQPTKPENLGKNFKKLAQLREDVGPGPAGNAAYDDVEPGMDVEHNLFGKGKVVAVEGNGPNKKATVLFGIGQKQLLLKFAKLRRL